MKQHNTGIWPSVSETVIFLPREASHIQQEYQTLSVSPTPAQRPLHNTTLVWAQQFFHLSKVGFFLSPHQFLRFTQSPADLPSSPGHPALRTGSSAAASSTSTNKAALTLEKKKKVKSKLMTNHKMVLLKEKGEVGKAFPRN